MKVQQKEMIMNNMNLLTTLVEAEMLSNSIEDRFFKVKRQKYSNEADYILFYSAFNYQAKCWHKDFVLVFNLSLFELKLQVISL